MKRQGRKDEDGSSSEAILDVEKQRYLEVTKTKGPTFRIYTPDDIVGYILHIYYDVFRISDHSAGSGT